MRILKICTPHQMSLGLGNRVGWNARGTRHLTGEKRIAYRVLVGNLMVRNSLEDPGLDEINNIKQMIIKVWVGIVTAR